MSTNAYSDEDLADLTEAERAALTDPDAGGDGADDDTTTTTEQESGDADGNEDEGAGDDAAGAAGADDTAPPVADDAATDASADEPSAAPGTPAQPAPILVAEAPADAEAKLADIATKKAELDQKFDDGEIVTSEYRKEIDALNKQEREIELAQSRAQIAADMKRQQEQNQWNSDCETFLRAHQEYAGEANAERFKHLNEQVIALANMPRHAGITGSELLAKAHRIVQLEYGETPAAADPKPEPKPKAAKPAEKNVPPSLHAVPAAETTDTTGGKWAALDRLSPDQLEEALMKMSDADRAAYCAAR